MTNASHPLRARRRTLVCAGIAVSGIQGAVYASVAKAHMELATFRQPARHPGRLRRQLQVATAGPHRKGDAPDRQPARPGGQQTARCGPGHQQPLRLGPAEDGDAAPQGDAVLTLPSGSVIADPGTRQIAITGGEAKLQAVAASTLNSVFNQPAPEPPPSSNFIVGDPFGRSRWSPRPNDRLIDGGTRGHSPANATDSDASTVTARTTGRPRTAPSPRIPTRPPVPPPINVVFFIDGRTRHRDDRQRSRASGDRVAFSQQCWHGSQ